MMQPNLFIMGAPKCGTTSLANWLGLHPEIFLPPVKEPHHYNKDESQQYYKRKEDYLALYKDGCNHRYRLDASVWYLHSSVAATEILNDCPEAKFIVCLRNPTDMAYSLHSQYLYKSGRETIADFYSAWSLSDERLAGAKIPTLASDPRYLAYKHSCRIGSQTRRLLDTVPLSQVKLVVLDDLVNHQEETLEGILRFLDLSVDSAHPLPKENPAISLRYPALRRLIIHGSRLKRRLGNFSTPRVVKTICNYLARPEQAKKLSEADRRRVTEYYLNEIYIIWELTGKRYEHWTRCLLVEDEPNIQPNRAIHLASP